MMLLKILSPRLYWAWLDMKFWYCTKVGHIRTPPYYFKFEGATPRCRRCRTSIIAEE